MIGPLSHVHRARIFPFLTIYYPNGYNFIEIELRRQGVAFRKDDNAFLSDFGPEGIAGGRR